jgi:hypothetical protein
MLAMLNVIIKGGRYSLVIRMPFTIPTKVPKARHIKIAGAVDMPFIVSHEIIMLERPSE